MQLGLANAAAICSGASELQPAGFEWLVSRAAAPTRGRQYELQFKREPPTKQEMGEGKYRQSVSPCEREETCTRPWSVLSVVEKGSNTGF